MAQNSSHYTTYMNTQIRGFFLITLRPTPMHYSEA